MEVEVLNEAQKKRRVRFGRGIWEGEGDGGEKCFASSSLEGAGGSARAWQNDSRGRGLDL